MSTLDLTGWRSLAASAAAVLALVLAAEGVARWTITDDDWRYWRFPVGERLDLLRERPVPDVLFVGDSTAAFNFVPATFDEMTGLESFNLGTRANAPLSFRETVAGGILPDLDALPRWLVVSFSSRTYWDDPNIEGWEKSVLSSPYARSLRGEPPYTEFIALARLRLLFFQGMNGLNAPDPRLEANAGWTPFGTGPQGRDRPHIAKIHYPFPRFPKPRAKSKKKRGKRPSAERLAALIDLAELHPEGGVVAVLMPGPRAYRAPLARAAKALKHPKLRVWDYGGEERYRSGDGVHMAPPQAKAFSRELGRRFVAEGLE